MGIRTNIKEKIAQEISSQSRYADSVIQLKPPVVDDGLILKNIENRQKKMLDSESIPADLLKSYQEDSNYRGIVLLNGNLNYSLDIQNLLSSLREQCSRHTRIVAVLYNPYLRWLYSLANLLGLRKVSLPTTFLTRVDLLNLCRLSGMEVVRLRPIFSLFGIRPLALVTVATLRPIKPISSTEKPPVLTVVIPARNEKGNIESAITRMPTFRGQKPEIIFVEGHSSDDTWGEILRIQEKYGKEWKISSFRQTGKGKNDAVRLGFSKATGDLLTILDADLTMPPEQLTRFYEAYCTGLSDFVNGSRLVYPMEGEAMRFLNRLGNVFFAKALSYVLDGRLGDSLCGTKLVTRRDYSRFIEWRNHFGDFDPFGDFELLFPANILSLGVVDIPIYYRARTYGATNIHRFRHGLMLLKMTWIGWVKVR